MALRLQSETNCGLIHQLEACGIIKNKTVADVMKQTDRKIYCPVNHPYVDKSESIGEYTTIAAPHIHAYILENLYEFINADSKILDIDCGSGYLTACFARLIEARAEECNTIPNGMTISFEEQEELVEFAIDNLNTDDPDLIADERVKIIHGNGRVECGDYGPFDVIYVGGNRDATPIELYFQLKFGGRMLCVLNTKNGSQQIMQYYKNGSGEIIKKPLLNVM
uniref:protein-L-isoaspartate(D-aspartate) O-methyltransferase n=1 Tax=Polypedilum vanderplanki TaxID=319348 RepID=S6BTK4_POLVA|nr:protein L-isoaspartyl methyltransferase [Polypedilum vanderplanki]